MHLATNDVVAAFRRVACADPSTTIVALWDPRPVSDGNYVSRWLKSLNWDHEHQTRRRTRKERSASNVAHAFPSCRQPLPRLPGHPLAPWIAPERPPRPQPREPRIIRLPWLPPLFGTKVLFWMAERCMLPGRLNPGRISHRETSSEPRRHS